MILIFLVGILEEKKKKNFIFFFFRPEHDI
jgi:hypothetical protein